MAGLVVEAVVEFGIPGRADLEPENDQDRRLLLEAQQLHSCRRRDRDPAVRHVHRADLGVGDRRAGDAIDLLLDTPVPDGAGSAPGDVRVVPGTAGEQQKRGRRACRAGHPSLPVRTQRRHTATPTTGILPWARHACNRDLSLRQGAGVLEVPQ